MVDIFLAKTTVRCMTSNSILILLGICGVLGSLGGLVFLRTRKLSGNKVAGTIPAAPETPAASETTTSAGKQEPRIERVATAYENGEIDERMLRTAARALGINVEEARARLEGAAEADTASGTSERMKNRAHVSTRNRKKNKQAKRSRQANRR